MNKNDLEYRQNKLCIYEIRNLTTNEFYIGSALNGAIRFHDHFKSLKNGKHHNWPLQESYNKYGPNHFQFTILKWFYEEEMPRKILYELEQRYIDMLKPQFNLSLKVRAPSCTKEQREAAALKRSKEYWITDPQGKEFLVRGLRQFCRKQGISQNAMLFVLKGTWRHHKGWKVRYKDDSENRYKPRQEKYWIVVSPEGKEQKILGLKRFCKENGLCKTSMLKIAKSGKIYKGWKCFRC